MTKPRALPVIGASSFFRSASGGSLELRHLPRQILPVAHSDRCRYHHRHEARAKFEILTGALAHAPRWLFFAALLYAPWDYGSTTAHGIVRLNWLLGSALLLWIFDLLVARRLPSVPLPLVIISLALLGLGWWMALNAHWIYDPDYYIFIPISSPLASATGSVDRAVSVAWMVRATMLLGVACFVADLSQRREWVLRLWWAIGIAAGSIALLGLLQKSSGAAMIFWKTPPVPDLKTFFATFYYHANAGAFLNLTLPLTCGLAIRSWIKPSSPPTQALWLSATMIVLIAALANTSRMGQLITLLLIAILVIRWSKLLVRKIFDGRWKVAGLIVVIAALFAIAQASHLDEPLHRWQTLAQQFPTNARWLASQAALGAVSDAGWFGFGPGTFRVIFPYYTNYLGDRIQGAWRFLHEDYLQTLIEWGWIGGAFWAAFLFGGVGVALCHLRSAAAQKWSPRYRAFLFLAVLALCGVSLHALVDFPLQIASLQLYLATYLGVCWGSSRWEKTKVPVVSRMPEALPTVEGQAPRLSSAV